MYYLQWCHSSFQPVLVQFHHVGGECLGLPMGQLSKSHKELRPSLPPQTPHMYNLSWCYSSFQSVLIQFHHVCSECLWLAMGQLSMSHKELRPSPPPQTPPMYYFATIPFLLSIYFNSVLSCGSKMLQISNGAAFQESQGAQTITSTTDTSRESALHHLMSLLTPGKPNYILSQQSHASDKADRHSNDVGVRLLCVIGCRKH